MHSEIVPDPRRTPCRLTRIAMIRRYVRAGVRASEADSGGPGSKHRYRPVRADGNGKPSR
ncbi:hypothetical protein HMI57_17430 [Arthrobacter sp. 260]|nr:hypothetical protein [Arthrobacter sp. 260]